MKVSVGTISGAHLGMILGGGGEIELALSQGINNFHA